MSDSSSLERESISSSSSSSYGPNGPYGKVGIEGEERENKQNTHSLSFNNFRQLLDFIFSHEDKLISLKYLVKHKTVLQIMEEMGAFTKTSLLEFCQELEIKVIHRTIKQIVEILNKFNVIDFAMVQTTLHPAEIYYFPGLIESERIFHKMVKKYQMRYELTNQKLKGKSKEKTPEDIKEKMKEKWAAQKRAAQELLQEEADLEKRLKEEREENEKENRIRKHISGLNPRKKHLVDACNICKHDIPLVKKLWAEEALCSHE